MIDGARAMLERLNPSEKLVKYRQETRAHNLRSLTIASFAGLLLMATLTLLSLPFIGVLKLLSSYLLLTIFFGLVLALAKAVLPKHPQLTLPLCYVLMTAVYCVSIWMGTARGVTTNATTFMLFLLLFPLFFIDRPDRLIAFNVLFTLVFCGADLHYKPQGELLGTDLSNMAVVCCLSAFFIMLTVRRELHTFDVNRAEEDKVTQKDFLINAIPVGIAIYEVRGAQTQQVFTNDSFYRLFDDTREARDKRTKGNFLNSIHPDDRSELLHAIKTVIDGRDEMVQVCRSAKGDGSYIWVRFAASVAKREGDYLEVYCTYSSMEEEIRNKQASEAKTIFLSRMSHDIRTPMNAIIGMTNLARQEADMGKVQEYLDYIDHSSEFLLGLINDVLDLSKIESGEFTLTPEPYPVEDFDADIRAIIVPLMEKRHIRFTYRMEGKIDCILVDRLRFNQIFFNLLSNASKFTPEGGSVEFLSHALPSKNQLHGIRFIVRDNGIGMSEAFQKNMFVPFVQDAEHLHEQRNGTGLGLPIVKSIVDAMGGAISVRSKLNEGSEIIVDLYVPVPDEHQPKAQARQALASLEGMRVLLAEDNEMNILVAKRLLESKGCIVTVTQTGKDCLDTFATSAPYAFDVILMDVRMPVMDGITATKQIRALPREDAQAVGIIAMTADAFSEEKKRTIEAGMNAHLSKPIVPTLLFDTLAQYRLKR